MPIFEVEASGKTYEVDAPSMDAAAAAFSGQSSGGMNERLNALTGGIIEGIPVVGPYLKAGADRLGAAARSVVNDTKYADELDFVQKRTKEVAAENPGTNLAGQVIGGVAGTAPLVAAAPAAFGIGAGPLLGRAAAGAATGAAIGGADAAVRSSGDLSETVTGAALGGITGGAAPAIGAAAGKLAGRAANRVAPAAVRSTDDWERAATAAYKAADEAGVIVKADPYKSMADAMFTKLANEALDPTLHPKATAALKRIEEVAGEPITLKSLENLRRVISAAGEGVTPSEGRIVGIMKREFDRFLSSLKAADTLAGDPIKGVSALKGARSAWAIKGKSEAIQDAIRDAELRVASTGSGGNINNAIRQNLRSLLKSDGHMFNAEERAQIERVIRGGPVQNLMRLVGKLSPSGNGLMAALGIGATAANPLMAVPVLAGMGAKAAADRATTRNAQILDLIVRNAGSRPISPYALPATQVGGLLGQGASFGILPVANQQRIAR